MQNPVRVNSRDGCPLCFAPKTSWWGVPCAGVPLVDTIQDFLYEFSMKPARYACSRNHYFYHDIVRPAKIIMSILKDYKNSNFQSQFSVLKISQIFLNVKNIRLSRKPTFINEIFWKLWFLKYFVLYVKFMSALLIILVFPTIR